jgi:hypothetical protein
MRGKIVDCLLLVFSVLVMTSCASAPLADSLQCADGTTATLTAAQFRQHVLMFDSLGRMRQPLDDGAGAPKAGAFPILDAKAAADYRANVVQGIRDTPGPVELLFFFHGGLNSRTGALQRAATDILRMKCEKRDQPLYPIFVNWQTSLPASYKDHLISVHKGHEALAPARVLAWPFQLGSDLARAVIESPVAYYLHIWDRSRSWKYKDETDKIAAVAPECGAPQPQFFREGESRTRRLPAALDIAKGVVMSPITLGGAGLIDAAGSSAWGAMIYTSDRLFFNPQEIHHDYKYTPSDTGAGGLAAFLRLLRDDEDLRKRLDITIVAHSAGAVVANKLVSYFGTLPIHNLVYMAPACTIDELMAGGKLTQFLRDDPKHRRLYILTLHEKAELENQTFFGLAPRGTLLVWLDEFIQPKSSEFTGMMLGRARNLRLHVHLMPCDVQKQVFITAFDDDASSTTQPQTHGGFGDLPYWRRAQWYPEDIATVKPICFSKSQLTCDPAPPAAP